MNRIVFYTTLLLLTFKFSSVLAYAYNTDSIIELANKERFYQPDSAIMKYEKCLPLIESQQDCNRIVDLKLKLTKLYSGNGNYQNAYDEIWSLIPYVESPTFRIEQVELNLILSSLYIIFTQYEKSNHYIEKAYSLIPKLATPALQHYWKSRTNSIHAWLVTNESGDFYQSEQLLIGAVNELELSEEQHTDYFIKLQLAELYITNDKLTEAEFILTEIEMNLGKKRQTIHSLLYDHLGQLYLKQEHFKKASDYFIKCIECIDLFKNHLDNKVEVLDSLASCYHYLGKDDLAFKYARESAKVSAELFGTKSTINKTLFEIRNTYQDQLEQQNIELLKEEKTVLRLKAMLYISFLLVVIIALFLRSRNKNKRLKLIEEKRQLEKYQQKQTIESKNKELMSSALQLLERDALLDDIKADLNNLKFKSTNQKIINEIVSAIHAKKSKKWEEFDLYFTQVNEDFYTSLKDAYPELSSTDLKMCALMKLGLSSKEMADIMAIGTDSVNTSRSRIRKKMNLSREVNLTDFLSNLTA